MSSEGIFNEIVKRAKASWPDDRDMQAHCISAEKEAFEELQRLDFGEYDALKQELIVAAKEVVDSWDDILDYVQSEYSAFLALRDLSTDGIDVATLDAWKREAADNYPDHYEVQLDCVKSRIQKHFSYLKRVGP